MTRTLTILITLGLGATAHLLAADKKIIETKGAAAGLPFSEAIRVGDTLYVSGMQGDIPKTGKLPPSFEAEVRQCLDNIGGVLKQGGMDFKDAVAVQVYLSDIDMFPRMNEVYKTYFPVPRPTRTTVQVARLVNNARIEITVTARK
ncbi:MAG: RidA family protein [Bryobacteraceae bacterium]